MVENKSTYEKMLEEFHAQGNVKSLSGEEHIELSQELNVGMSLFLLEQKRQQAKAQKELTNFIINS